MSQSSPAFSGNTLPPKPRRPLTCYGIFSVLERNYIWQQDHAVIPSSVTRDAGVDPYAASRPLRYRDLVLPSNWFVVGMNRKKRSKSKVHSVIAFKDLTKTIAERWKSVSPEVKMYCELIAVDELERYRRDINAYKEKYGNDAVKPRVSKRGKPCKPRVQRGSFGDSDSSRTRSVCDNKCNNESSDSEVSGTSSNAVQVHGHRLSDYLSDDRKEALELLGYNYDNILTGTDLLTAFDDFDESDEESEKDHSSRNDSSSTTQGFSLFEASFESPGQNSPSASQLDQSQHSSPLPALGTVCIIPSSTSPSAPDSLKSVHMYDAFQNWYYGRRMSC